MSRNRLRPRQLLLATLSATALLATLAAGGTTSATASDDGDVRGQLWPTECGEAVRAAGSADASAPEVTSLARDARISAREAVERIGWQQAAPAFAGIARTAVGPQSYGGLWIDQATGRVQVGVITTTGSSLDDGSLDGGVQRGVEIQAARCGLAGAVDVVAVKHSAAHLEAVNDWLAERMAAMDSVPSGFGAGIDHSANRVALDVPADRALTAAERALVRDARARWADAVAVEHTTGTAVTAEGRAVTGTCTSNGDYCDAPLRGGVKLDGSDDSACTLGFIATSRTDGLFYALTAGHCGASVYYSRFADGDAHRIGRVHKREFSEAGDAGIVRIENVDGWTPLPFVAVFRSGLTDRDEMYPIYAVAGSVVGMRVCKTGYATDTHCGTVTKLGVTANYKEGSVRGLAEANYCANRGDSGGPVYASHIAFGITSGFRQGASPCESLYQGVTRAQNLLNVDLALARRPAH